MQKAFSLVELSIVLVILGLLTGGILAGQSLIHAAGLRRVVSELTAFHSAHYAFRDKYFALPGDMNNASSFWGLRTATNCWSTQSTDATTCNGNGDGIIIWTASSNEPFRYWQHLNNAGLIAGSYSGVAASAATTHASPPFNVPTGPIGSAGFSGYSMYQLNSPGTAFHYAKDYGNHITYGHASTNTFTTNPLLKPEDAWNIDTKLDDGKPGHGKIMSMYWDTCTSSANNADVAGDYSLTLTTNECNILYLLR